MTFTHPLTTLKPAYYVREQSYFLLQSVNATSTYTSLQESQSIIMKFKCIKSTVYETALVRERGIKNKKAVLSQRWPRDARYISRSWAVAEMWPFEIIQDVGGRHLEFIRIENSAIRSAVPENPTLEPNMKWIGSPVAEMWPFAYGGGIWNPHFGGSGGRRGSAMAPLERERWIVSYRLSIVTVVISVTIRLQFAIECLRRSNQQGWVTLGPNLGCSLWSRPSCWGCKERTSQAN